VFECFLSLEEMRQLYEKVKKLVKPAEDDVRFYWISEEAVSRVLVIGGEAPQPPPKYYVI
jgi:CRISPR-associated protein Cas2